MFFYGTVYEYVNDWGNCEALSVICSDWDVAELRMCKLEHEVLMMYVHYGIAGNVAISISV